MLFRSFYLFIYLAFLFFLAQSRAKHDESPVAALITVDQSGHGDYRRIQDAIDAVPSGNSEEVFILVRPGVYDEKVVVPKDKPFITLSGTKAKTTIITWDNNGNLLKSATLAVFASDFMARSLTIQNTRGRGAPAVALRVSGDRAAFIGCRILSYQDTLLDDKGRHYYSKCYIEGATDFICGNGNSLFEKCQLHSIAEGNGVITAQHRNSPNEDTGFTFVKCKISGVKNVTLGRPWGAYSRVIFAYTYMSNVVVPQGWDDWGDSSKQSTVYYGQYKCYGPGAKTSERVHWARTLSTEEAEPFLSQDIIGGTTWVRSTPKHFKSVSTPLSSINITL